MFIACIFLIDSKMIVWRTKKLKPARYWFKHCFSDLFPPWRSTGVLQHKCLHTSEQVVYTTWKAKNSATAAEERLPLGRYYLPDIGR